MSAAPHEGPEAGRGRFPVLLLAGWFGLATGLVELALLIFRVKVIEKGVFLRSRHFPWMVPASDLALFVGFGLALALLTRPWPKWRPALIVGAFLFLATLSQLLLVRGLHVLACGVMSAGCARMATPAILARREGCLKWARRSIPVLLGAWVVLIGLTFANESLARRGNRPAPPPGSWNVLLVVLDTVRADRLSLHGYGRETTPHLSRIAEGGVRFDKAHSTAPWTLPSHASLFTGRWPHELDVEGHGGLDGAYATLAEYLRDRGYETAGVVANQFFCGHETGLDRGFDVYKDYPLTPGEVLRSSTLGWFLARNVGRAQDELGQRLWPGSVAGFSPDFRRKGASDVNGEFLDWLSTRGDRPYFAFLNYFDAHAPYVVPEGFRRHFGRVPDSRADKILLRDSSKTDGKSRPPGELELFGDAYDDCLASLDQDLGKLFDDLRRGGQLDRTLVVITADHGEEFGEHGHLGHGFSLYEPEIHVPLLILGPRRVPRGQVVRDPVSLRDVPATILGLLGHPDESPFPGTSLARTWEPSQGESPGPASPVLSELRPLIEPTLERPAGIDSPIPATSLLDGRCAYIVDRDGREELYDLEADPHQARDLSQSPASGPILARSRQALKATPDVRPGPKR